MQRPDIEALLPAVFQDAIHPGSPLDAVLEVAACLPQPVEELLASADRLFDPRRAPAEMVAFLAHWVDLDHFLVGQGSDGSGGSLPTGLGHLRELCAAAAELSRQRGTCQGLVRFLEIATGHVGFRIEENVGRGGAAHPFHLSVTAPATAQDYRELIHAIVAFEKPAYVTYDPEELRFE